METNRLSTRLSEIYEEVERFEDYYGPILKEVETLRSKQRELDAQLAATTPQGYYDRVLNKLECTGGDIDLLLEALSDAPGSSEPVEHGMGEASTGRYFTLQERDLPLKRIVSRRKSGSRTSSSAMEALLKLKRKCGSHEDAITYVEEMENDLVRKATQLDAVTPAKMISRVKCKLSWVGDITLLCDALYDGPLTESETNRQVVLVEAKVVACEPKIEHTAKTKEMHSKRCRLRTVGQKRRRCSSNEGETDKSESLQIVPYTAQARCENAVERGFFWRRPLVGTNELSGTKSEKLFFTFPTWKSF